SSANDMWRWWIILGFKALLSSQPRLEIISRVEALPNYVGGAADVLVFQYGWSRRNALRLQANSPSAKCILATRLYCGLNLLKRPTIRGVRFKGGLLQLAVARLLCKA